MAKKITKPLVTFGYNRYVFDTIEQAANAIKFFSKLRPVEYESGDGSGGYYRPAAEDEHRFKIELETHREFRESPKRIGLPAPKRGTIACAVCESVSVKPGTACQSCGSIAPLI
jgi:hypothetical protein